MRGPAIEDHAAIGDGRTIALVDGDGRIDWLPLPALDSSPVFAALLDEDGGGAIELRPAAEATPTRRYVRGTNVLETTWTTSRGGKVRVTDALVTGVAGRLPWGELARVVEGLEGSVTMEWRVTPGTCLGTRSPWIETLDHSAVARVGDLSLGVTVEALGTPQLDDDGDLPSIVGRFRTRPGSEHTLVLAATSDEPLHLPHPGNVRRGVQRTIDAWHAWSREFAYEGPWKDAVQRSALALKLLIHSPTGAVAAAGTTSLPENPAGGKNWDYRYAWVRDLAYTTRSLVDFGLREETHAAISWMLSTLKADGSGLEIFYQLDGGHPPEVTTYDVPGWRGIGPVVSGNRARGQRQLGVYGDLLGLVRAYVGEGNVLDVSTRSYLADIADRVCDEWREKDAGMWELEEEAHHTSSKMGCWQALDSAVWLAGRGEIAAERAERWRVEAERIREWVAEHCWSEVRRAYTMTAGGNALDASVLLHAPSGFDRGARMSSTIDALRAELGSGDQLFRYSDMEGEEHPFTACAFWEVSALACVGRTEEAAERMDRLVAATNDVGLMAEMTTAEGEFWGNFPQALSHLALIDAAVVLRELA